MPGRDLPFPPLPKGGKGPETGKTQTGPTDPGGRSAGADALHRRYIRPALFATGECHRSGPAEPGTPCPPPLQNLREGCTQRGCSSNWKGSKSNWKGCRQIRSGCSLLPGVTLGDFRMAWALRTTHSWKCSPFFLHIRHPHPYPFAIQHVTGERHTASVCHPSVTTK